MDKRQSTAGPKSPLRKKLKQPLKPRKTYFFQPQNTLAYNPNATRSTSPEPTTTFPRCDIPPTATSPLISLESDDGPAEPVKDVPSVAKNPVGNVSIELQGSDDSFDGVRWKPLTTTASNIRVPLLSSPLRNSDQVAREPTTVVNELTDSMLGKYGLGLENSLSQTPQNPRSRSDNSRLSDSSKPSYDASPSLQRSKSFDPRTAPSREAVGDGATDASKLNTWIDMFDVADTEKKPFRVAPASESNDDGLSSDEDTFLANLRVDSFPPLLQVPASSQAVKNDLASSNVKGELVSSQVKGELASSQVKGELSRPRLVKVEADSDPFSDDLDLDSIESFAATSISTTASASTTATSSFLKPSEGAIKLEQLGKQELLTVKEIPKKQATKADKPDAKLSFSRPDFARYIIKSVLTTHYTHKTFKRKQHILSVLDQDNVPGKLIIRGEAAELDLQERDIVHVIHTSPDSPRLVDDSHNLLIWNPDTLVSSTVVADQLFCPRKTVLSKRLSPLGEYTIPLFVGTIVHEIFQLCFVTGEFTREHLENTLNIEIKHKLLEIFTIGDIVEELKSKIRRHFPYIRRWFLKYYQQRPVAIPTNKQQQRIKFSVAEALDIEESVWSPMFGIKGMADVTLRANLEGDTSSGQFLLPMEIKTSQQYLSHQAQAALYSLLFKDRYNINISSFLLVYTLNEGSTTKHDISTPDLKSLMGLRNRISKYLSGGNQDLPDLMRQQQCDRCNTQESCMTYNFLKEGGTSEISGLKEGLYDALTDHLAASKRSYRAFLEHWDNLLTKEEEFAFRFNKDLWVLTAQEREEVQGKALADLVMFEDSELDKNERGEFIYTFKRASSLNDIPMTRTQIGKYDKVVISDNGGHFALALGYVRRLDEHSITITSKRRIIHTELKTDRFHRAGVLKPTQTKERDRGEEIIFRMDKDEMFYGMGTARFNILNLFLASGDHARRKLIVDLEAPKFSLSNNFELDLSGNHFNEDQKQAFEKVARTEDYSLILGMPGTGKTTVIAHLIKMLVLSKKTVLLTSYTNSAVDNILLKVKEYDVDFIRIGNPSRMHPYIRDYTPGSEKKLINDYESFKEVYMKPKVVAATCLGIRDVAFNIRDHFDYCIVDEASQVSMPLSLGPLAFADKFILVGDHFQLPPLVTHPEADVRDGLSKSLFQILAEAHPESISELKHQYRMCRDIMEISNVLVYNNRLLCGSDEVASQKLHFPHLEELATHRNPEFLDEKTAWLDHAFEERNKVIFFDHDPCSGYEKTIGENISNLTEVDLVRQTVEAACSCGLDPSKIGIMTLYRSQLKLLADTFRHMPQLEILTADRFQGRDKDCIIISMVRSNKDKRVGELLKDWRRINVAVTRARAKLIVFGSVSTLEQAESIEDFISLARQKDWIYSLPKHAKEMYQFQSKGGPVASPTKTQRKFGNKIVSKHPLVRDILADMNVN